MRCCLFTFIGVLIGLIAQLLNGCEAASLSTRVEELKSDPALLLVNDEVQRYQKRSLANGRWGLRPGKRSIVEPDADIPALDQLTNEVAERLNDRLQRSVATGRWGLRPGKRSIPAVRRTNPSDVFVLL